MKKHRIFNKGDYVYCLLSSYSHPDIFLPIKGIIIDSKWDPVNPLYEVKILKFFDNIKILKKYFFDMNFKVKFENRAKKFSLNSDDFKRVIELEERLNEKDHKKFHVIVESVMCTKTQPQLKELYNSVQFFLISRNLKQIRELASRAFYKGPMTVDTLYEFNKRFKVSWEDKFKSHDIDIDKYLDTLS